MTLLFTAESAEHAKRSRISYLRALGGKTVFAILAIGLGLLIARLPLSVSLAILVGGGLLALAVLEPLVGLGIMLLLAPAEPLLSAAGLLPFSIGQATFALFAGAWLLRGLARRELRWPALPITIPFALYLFTAALSLSVSHPASPKDGGTELLKWIEMYLVAGMVAASGRGKLKWVIAAIFLAGVAQAGIGLWQFQFRGHGPEAFKILGEHYRAYGTLEQPNPFAGFMGIVWPIAASVSVYFLLNSTLLIALTSALIALASLVALFISFSRGAWLGAAAAGLAMLVFWPRRRWIGLALASGGLVAVFALYQFGLLPASISSRFADVGDFVQVYDVRGVHVNDTNFAIVERLAHWQAAVNMANAHPVFGVGFGNYEAAYDDYRLIKWQYALGHAHMIYLNVLAETGALGLAAYLILWGAIFAITLRATDLSGLNRALAIGLLGAWTHLATHQLLDNLYVGNIPLLIGALLGVLCILATRETPNAGQNIRSTRSGSIR
ncbi:MAG: O-antigen ligase family protein [Chloroflexota bacterium]